MIVHQDALMLIPDNLELRSNFATVLQVKGEIDEATYHYEVSQTRWCIVPDSEAGVAQDRSSSCTDSVLLQHHDIPALSGQDASPSVSFGTSTC